MSSFQWLVAAGLAAAAVLCLVFLKRKASNKAAIFGKPKQAQAFAAPGGPVRLSLEKHLGQPWVDAATAHFAATELDWREQCTESWFLSIHHYDLEFLVQYLLNDHRSKQPACEQTFEKVAQLVTVSGALFNFAVPPALWRLDTGGIEMILRYKVLTNPVSVDFASYAVSPPVSSRRFMLLVSTLTDSLWLTHALASAKRPDNFAILKSALGSQLKSPWPFLLAEGDETFKKALSAVYLIGGFAVPRDYLYVDQEVKDYVLKTGRYAPFKPFAVHEAP